MHMAQVNIAMLAISLASHQLPSLIIGDTQSGVLLHCGLNNGAVVKVMKLKLFVSSKISHYHKNRSVSFVSSSVWAKVAGEKGKRYSVSLGIEESDKQAR